MGTLTITTTAAQDARMVAAYGRLLGTADANGVVRNATAAEVKAAIIQNTKNVVAAYEAQRAVELSTPASFDPT